MVNDEVPFRAVISLAVHASATDLHVECYFFKTSSLVPTYPFHSNFHFASAFSRGQASALASASTELLIAVSVLR